MPGNGRKGGPRFRIADTRPHTRIVIAPLYCQCLLHWHRNGNGISHMHIGYRYRYISCKQQGIAIYLGFLQFLRDDSIINAIYSEVTCVQRKGTQIFWFLI